MLEKRFGDWNFVVGDREKILPGLKELGLEIVLVDADGNPIPESKAKP